MADVLGNVSVTTIASATAAATATQLVRLGEVTTLLSTKAGTSHTHSGVDVVDLQDIVNVLSQSGLENSQSITWSNRTPSVVCDASRALSTTSNGVGVVLSTGVNDAARGNHTHAQLHSAVTVSGTGSLTLSLDGQKIYGAVVAVSGGGVSVTGSGIESDGTVSRTSHTHAQLHAPLTVSQDGTTTATLTSQNLTVAVKLSAGSTGVAGALISLADGVAVSLGSSGVQAAAGDHTHSNADSNSAGLLSAELYRKFQSFEESNQIEQLAQFVKPDFLTQNAYVGGKVRWGQQMQLVSANVVCNAPTVAGVSLAIEVNGVVIEHGLSVPQGNENEESTNAWDLTNLYVPANQYVRVLCESGVVNASDIGTAPSSVHFSINARPTVGTVPEIRLNCGGSASTPFAEDAYYDGGSSKATPGGITTVGVSDPAPQSVYKTARYTTENLVYTVTGLGKGITYLIRLHFADIFNTAASAIPFDLEIQGLTLDQTVGINVQGETGGAFKAMVFEYNMAPDADGVITFTFRGYGELCFVNGIEIIQ